MIMCMNFFEVMQTNQEGHDKLCLSKLKHKRAATCGIIAKGHHFEQLKKNRYDQEIFRRHDALC